MKNFLKKVVDSFGKENGWKHLLGLIFIGYFLLFWGNTDYASNTPRIPSAMLYDWVTLINWQRLILSFLIGFAINFVYEFVLLVFKGIKISISDCLWAGLGLIIGDLFYQLLPKNILILILSICAVLFTFFYVILTSKGKWKKS